MVDVGPHLAQICPAQVRVGSKWAQTWPTSGRIWGAKLARIRPERVHFRRTLAQVRQNSGDFGRCEPESGECRPASSQNRREHRSGTLFGQHGVDANPHSDCRCLTHRARGASLLPQSHGKGRGVHRCWGAAAISTRCAPARYQGVTNQLRRTRAGAARARVAALRRRWCLSCKAPCLTEGSEQEHSLQNAKDWVVKRHPSRDTLAFEGPRDHLPSRLRALPT